MFNLLALSLLFAAVLSSERSITDSEEDDNYFCDKNNAYSHRGRYYKERYGIEIIYLDNSDFKNGSLRIKDSGYYALSEDIIFSPNENLENPNAECAWIPCNDPEYPGSNDDDIEGPFLLGFFAAIVIESDDVTINLCGYKIVQSPEFYIQQRFYSHIEVSNQVLLNTQGPFRTGDNLITNKNIIIKNGELGLSSHWGVHGLGPENIIISKLKIHSFEIAGIHINGYKNLYINNIEIGGTSSIVPARFPYATGRVLIRPLARLVERIPDAEILFSDRFKKISVKDIFDELILQLNLFYFYITGELGEEEIDGLEKDDPDSYISLQKALFLFDNKLNLPDCASQYGLLLNSGGFATQNFGDGIGFSENAWIENIFIHDMFMQMEEGISYHSTDNNFIINQGPFGDSLNFRQVIHNIENIDLSSKLDELNYNGNIISDIKIFLAKFGVLPEERHGTSISSEVIDWVLGIDVLKGFFRCNQDIMNHLGKGSIGFRIDNSNNVYTNNIKISSLNNWSKFGILNCGNYNSSDNGGHVRQTFGEGFGSSNLRGISITGSNNVILKNIYINNLNSRIGNSFGIDILKNNTKIIFKDDIKINNINSGTDFNKQDLLFLKSKPNNPNDIPLACDVNIFDPNDAELEIIGKDNVMSDNINGPKVCGRNRRGRDSRRRHRNKDGSIDERDCDLRPEIPRSDGPVTWGGCKLWAATFPGVTYTGEEDIGFDRLYECNGCFKDGINGLTGEHPGISEEQYNCGRWDVRLIKKECVDNEYCIGKYSNMCDISDPLFDSNDWESGNNFFSCPLFRYRP